VNGILNKGDAAHFDKIEHSAQAKSNIRVLKTILPTDISFFDLIISLLHRLLSDFRKHFYTIQNRNAFNNVK